MTQESTKIEFIQWHQPQLRDGDYTIQLQQEVEDIQNRIPPNFHLLENAPKTFANLERTFRVVGERFHLNPSDINAVFPPANNAADHAHVLPHIVLNRSTLPWERIANRNHNGEEDYHTPWLALLVFHEDEIAPLASSPEHAPSPLSDTSNSTRVTTSVVPLSELLPPSDHTPFFPGLHLETGQKDNDRVQVIDIPTSLLAEIVPGADDMQLLTHVRQATDDKGNIIGQEKAVIVANRLPQPGKTSTVHLVSLENRMKKGIFNFEKSNHIQLSDNTTPPLKTRLISLKSWRFTCTEHYLVNTLLLNAFEHKKDSLIGIDSSTTIENLNPSEYFSKHDFILALTTPEKGGLTHEHLARKDTQGISNEEKICKAFGLGDFAAILRSLNSSTLKLPAVSITDEEKSIDQKKIDSINTANAFLNMSFTPIEHRFRQGDTSVSWYRGPLIASQSSQSHVHLPSMAADPLLQYFPKVKMLNVSYAAAWEMGRLLALQDKHFSTSLFRWKRGHMHEYKKNEQLKEHQNHHLPATDDINLHANRLPANIQQWLYERRLLKGLPFQYLVPEEAMLPVESIRFFTLDKYWLAALLDGVFSVGRVITHEHKRDETILHGLIKQAFSFDPHSPQQQALDLNQENSASLKETLDVLPDTSGFLLRSEIVSGWPELLVEGYNEFIEPNQTPDAQSKINLIRFERLSDNILLCLFSGSDNNPTENRHTLKTVDIHLKPEAIHFGFSVSSSTETDSQYTKTLRNILGQENVSKPENYTTKIPLKNKTRVIDIKVLTNNIGTLYQKKPEKIGWTIPPTSKDFALQMIEGVEKVRLNIKR